MWHLHTPKTAGTALRAALDDANVLDNLGGSPHYNFMSRTARMPQLWGRVAKSLRRAQREGRPRFFSEEIALENVRLEPFANATCLLAVLREPTEWFISAAWHMGHAWKGFAFHPGLGLDGVPMTALLKEGYFKWDHAQTRAALHGLSPFRRLFLVALPALEPFLRLMSTSLHLERTVTLHRGTEQQVKVNAACKGANCSRLGPNAPTLRWIAEHFTLDVQAWGTLASSRDGVALFSPTAAMTATTATLNEAPGRGASANRAAAECSRRIWAERTKAVSRTPSLAAPSEYASVRRVTTAVRGPSDAFPPQHDLAGAGLTELTLPIQSCKAVPQPAAARESLRSVHALRAVLLRAEATGASACLRTCASQSPLNASTCFVASCMETAQEDCPRRYSSRSFVRDAQAGTSRGRDSNTHAADSAHRTHTLPAAQATPVHRREAAATTPLELLRPCHRLGGRCVPMRGFSSPCLGDTFAVITHAPAPLCACYRIEHS